jgi:hypothetical protein
MSGRFSSPATFGLSAVAEGRPGDGRYPLPPLPRSVQPLVDVAAMTDGGVVVSDQREIAWRLPPGSTTWRRVPGLRPAGLTGTVGNRLLAIDADDRIVQWTPGMRPVTVAGTGQRGFGGDGGAATAALINPALGGSEQSRGIAALADGGFLYADTYNHRVRHVDVTGVIGTVAGTGRKAPGGTRDLGDGGPATSASLRLPSALAVLPGGGHLVLEAGDLSRDRLRRVSPEGVSRRSGLVDATGAES